MVAVGTHRGFVQVWDVAAQKRVNTLQGHSARVGALAWNSDTLSSGSRDRLILQRDVRTPSVAPERRLVGHRQEVCGLKWSPDSQYLASGGNDNKLFVWGGASTSPAHTFTDHIAAVKAIAWSPHHHGLLRRRHRRQVHQVLEHAHRPTHAICGHRKPGGEKSSSLDLNDY